MYFKKVPFFFSLLLPKAIWSIHTEEFVYLTFDDGPHPSSTPYLLDLLDSLDIKANFFCLGSKAIKYPHLIQDITSRGHDLGYHGFDHLSGWTTSHSAYVKNAEPPRELMSSTLYRPPYGRMTWSQYNTITKSKDIIMWDVMPGDFDEKLTKVDVLNNLKNNSSAGSIIALHDTSHSWNKNKYALSEFSLYNYDKGLRFGLLSDTLDINRNYLADNHR